MPNDQRSEDSREDDDSSKRATFLLLRAFLGPFWILQCYFKLRNPATGKLGLDQLWQWSSHQVADFASTTPLAPWVVRPYTLLVPGVELGVGLMILLGVRTRWALIAAAGLLISLDMGLMLKGDHETVKSNTLILLTLLWALSWVRYNRWTVDEVLRSRRRRAP